MFAKSFLSSNVYRGLFLFLCVLGVGIFFANATPASAQTGSSVSELQAQIDTLMARISALQGGGTSRPSDETFKVTVSNFTATVSFTLSNGCGGYVISWGDGAKTELVGSPAGRACTMAIVNVAKNHTYAKVGTYNVTVERFNGQTLKDTSTKEIKVGPEARRNYTLADVQSVTKQFVDPSKAIADEEYTLYVITLKTGKKIEVKVPVRTMPGTAEEAFKKTGFVGRASELMSRAREITSPAIIGCTNGLLKYKEGDKLQSIIESGSTRTIADASFVCRSGKWVIEGSMPGSSTTSSSTPRIKSVVASPNGQYVATVVLGRPTTTRSVMGPINLGAISWGDRVTENIYTLVTGPEMTVTRNHTYRTPGTYTVSVKGLNGVTATQKVVVGTTVSGTGSSALPGSQPSGFGSSSSSATGIVRGASIDVFAEISTTLTTISEMLKTIK